MNIVLAHGILGFSRLNVPLLPIDYFAGVKTFLETRFQASVIAPAVDPTAGIDARADMLRSRIHLALAAGQLNPADPIHIVAHSMGGLDSRRLITKGAAIDVDGRKVPIRTLATVGTPHQGSPIADLVALEPLHQNPILDRLLQGPEAALASFLAVFKISLQGLHDLTTASAIQFDKDNPLDRSVRYLSVSGRGRHGVFPTSGFFLPYYQILKLRSLGKDQSDGVVPASSAKYGEFDDDLWPCDHADEIGHNLDVPLPLDSPPDETLARYQRLVERF